MTSFISSKVSSIFLIVLGSILLVIGFIGLVLPVIPGFIFLIAGAYLLARARKERAMRAAKGGTQ